MPLSFLGQISTSEITVPPGCPELPPDTLLAFFYEAADQQGWGLDPADHQYWKVIAVPRATAPPADAPAEVRVFSPRRLVPEQVTTIPDPDEPAIEGLCRATGDEDRDDRIIQSRSHHQTNGEHMHRFNDGKQQIVFANVVRDAAVLEERNDIGKQLHHPACV